MTRTGAILIAVALSGCGSASTVTVTSTVTATVTAPVSSLAPISTKPPTVSPAPGSADVGQQYLAAAADLDARAAQAVAKVQADLDAKSYTAAHDDFGALGNLIVESDRQLRALSLPAAATTDAQALLDAHSTLEGICSSGATLTGPFATPEPLLLAEVMSEMKLIAGQVHDAADKVRADLGLPAVPPPSGLGLPTVPL